MSESDIDICIEQVQIELEQDIPVRKRQVRMLLSEIARLRAELEASKQFQLAVEWFLGDTDMHVNPAEVFVTVAAHDSQQERVEMFLAIFRNKGIMEAINELSALKEQA